MSDLLPSREQALSLLREVGCSPKVIEHCVAVSALATETAEACRRRGLKVNLQLVEVGALLHDIGRSKTHSVNHALVGAELARKAGLPEVVVSIIKRHVGGGITAIEAVKIGWPKDNYVPTALEEKIVSYADKLIGTSERIPIEVTLKKLKEEGLETATKRVRLLHDEVARLAGEEV